MSRRRPSLSTTPESDSHFVQMAEWLALESKAESERILERIQNQQSKSAERTGESLLDLVMTDHAPGIGGHYLIQLMKRSRSTPMPWHRLKSGSPVLLSSFPDSSHETINGVVSSRTSDSIQVAVDRWPESQRFRVDLTSDEVTRRRQLSAIQTAKDSRGRLGHLRHIMMGEKQPGSRELPELNFAGNLNKSQQEAVRMAMAAEDVAVIHGPPGTGKTTTVIEVIIQAVRLGQKVLVTAPSNTAVDNVLEKLLAAGEKAVRLGHPARVAEDLQMATLDGQVQQHPHMAIIRDMLREAESLYRKAERYSRAKPGRGAKQEMRREAARLKSDARHLERVAIENVLDQANIICATNTFNEEHVGQRWFDLLVIDEACQSTEPSCWVPLLCTDKVVMAGDHQQLPPTILSAQAAKEGFGTSLLERVIRIHGPLVTRMLQVQYRMNQQIMAFSSDTFYEGHLIADDSVATNRLTDFPTVTHNELTANPLTFIDTAGADWREEMEPQGRSRQNLMEAQLVVKKINALCSAGVPPSMIAVIAPYAAQVRRIREACEYPAVEIDTVDGFQGREKEAVILTLVRSNNEGEIGFLSETRRTNVALTRARSKLMVIGDSATLSHHPFYSKLIDYFQRLDAYQTIWEETD
ncbi:MAG: AAA domain-containing protein [Mariniblastus sp.]|nr:AAA domain-containing protein [Mariniblastus sp.]